MKRFIGIKSSYSLITLGHTYLNFDTKYNFYFPIGSYYFIQFPATNFTKIFREYYTE